MKKIIALFTLSTALLMGCKQEKTEVIDLPRLASIGEKGVLALFSDSTNAERPGFTMSEKK